MRVENVALPKPPADYDSVSIITWQSYRLRETGPNRSRRSLELRRAHGVWHTKVKSSCIGDSGCLGHRSCWIFNQRVYQQLGGGVLWFENVLGEGKGNLRPHSPETWWESSHPPKFHNSPRVLIPISFECDGRENANDYVCHGSKLGSSRVSGI